MKRWLLIAAGPIILLAGFVLPARAAKRVSVSQLEQAASELKGLSDQNAAQRLSDLELTERLSAQRFNQLTQLITGEESRQALRAIADQSQFLDPPASELPPNPAPSVADQRRIMGLVVTYVEKAIPQLPNFFATRTTEHFEDSPLIQHSLDFFTPYQPLHLLSRSEAEVFYRNGREVVDTKMSGNKQKPGGALTTWGIFGPILGTVLVDAARSQLAWSRWEQGSSGPLAVFAFHVLQEKSHYEVNYCCVADQGDVHPFRRIVPYHGSMTVDPATGVILRLVLEADLKATDPVVTASILVDYAPVEIGGSHYTCPTRSLSRTVAQGVQVDPVFKRALANEVQPLKTSLNDVTFDRYHVFRSDMRVLTPEEADLVQQAQPASPSAASAAEQPPPAPLETAPSSAVASAETKPEPAPSPIPATAPIPQPKTDAAAATPEITTAAATGLPDTPAPAASPATDTGYHLRTTSRLVEVTVVAFDKKGHPITDLKPSDFELYDNGRKQTINAFTQSSADSPSQPAATAAVARQPFTNRPIEAVSMPSGSPQAANGNTTVFLIDASHVGFGDLNYARSEMLRFLKTVCPDEPVGIYVLRQQGFQILEEPTVDRARLAATLAKWMPSAQDLAQAQGEEARNRQSMDYVHSLADLSHVNGNVPTGEADITGPIDPRLRSLGDNPQRDALIYLVWISRHLAATPGHKSLVWVASDNVLADFSDNAPSVEKGDKNIDPFALRAREALNDSHVSIYPLDASQLEPGGVGANIQHGNVQVAPGSEERVAVELQQLPPGQREEMQEELSKSQRDINPGRLTAQMHQDTHPIQPVFRELAEATGGRTLRRASDIAGEITSIVNDGRAAYQLSFAPDTAADDAYHHLTIKLANRRNVTLRYRTGYLYEKEPATLKERFHNALWRPADLTDIALSAAPAPGPKPATFKLNIAATDLALAQQGGFWMDKLDIFLVQRDDSRLHAKLDGQTLGLRLKPSTYQQVLKDGINIDEPLKALPETGALRIVVVDENNGRIGTLTLPASALNSGQ